MDISVRIARLAHRCYISRFCIGGGKIFKHINRVIFSCDIAYQVDVPSSLKLPHQGLGVVIHPAVKIGENCVIYQHVTLGADGKKGHEAPVIGNNVMIGAGAILLGNIRVGDNAIIAANSVVLHDVPEGAMVAGVPAKIKTIKS